MAFSRNLISSCLLVVATLVLSGCPGTSDSDKGADGATSNPNPMSPCLPNTSCQVDEINRDLVFSMMSPANQKNQIFNGFGNDNGQGIAVIGDINHDGFSDFAIGSPWGGDMNHSPQLGGTVNVVSGKGAALP